MILVRPSVLLAMGECLAVSASLETDKVPVSERIREISISLFRGASNVGELGREEAPLVFSTVYGGLILSHVCDPIAPISRAYVRSRIDLWVSESGEINDRKILKAWALIFSGKEREGLDLIKGETLYPIRVGWRPGGEIPISPVGIEIYE